VIVEKTVYSRRFQTAKRQDVADSEQWPDHGKAHGIDGAFGNEQQTALIFRRPVPSVGRIAARRLGDIPDIGICSPDDGAPRFSIPVETGENAVPAIVLVEKFGSYQFDDQMSKRKTLSFRASAHPRL
jgi:hypothetical protein